MKPHTARPSSRTRHINKVAAHERPIALHFFMVAWLVPLSFCISGSSLAAPVELERLFYTPAQRAQLEAARTHNVIQLAQPRMPGGNAPPPVRYDGVVTRSDGKTTRWVDGKAEVGDSSVTGLKPGQIRANGKVYEPYQVLRPTPSSPIGPDVKESAP
jgi:hypothetical protein